MGQLLNLASLAADCGVSQPTARRWLSTLEASFIAFRLPPFHANLGKRLVKRPKLYFYDPGLAASLLGIAELTLIEAKAGRTPSNEHFAALGAFAERIAARGDGRWRVARRMVVYGGAESQSRSRGELVSWTDLPSVAFDDHP